MRFTIYTSDTVQDEVNTHYRTRHEITDAGSLAEATHNDQVFAEYRNHHRANSDFMWSDVIPMDVDNDDNNPETWLSADDVSLMFADVAHAILPSRHDMKSKHGKAPRPRFHILFPIERVDDYETYRAMKSAIRAAYPFFDEGAADAARFFYASKVRPEDVIWNDAGRTIGDLVKPDLSDGGFGALPDHGTDRTIREGSRNTTMSKYAARILKKFGDTDYAYENYMAVAGRCEPPLGDGELKAIWSSALKFYERIKADPSYVPPEEFNDDCTYRPVDFTDVGQANALALGFRDILRYSDATHFLVFRNGYWDESEVAAQAVVHELTDRQLKEAEDSIMAAMSEIEENGALQLVNANRTKAQELMSDEQRKSYERYQDALAYRKFVLKRRESKYITACLKEVKPMIEISQSELDSDPFLICTPGGTYDLRKGMDGRMDNDPANLMTRITARAPSDEGRELWMDCLNTIFAKNPELIDYVQLICGLVAIGKIMVEGMIIAYGDGGNGKSTFWNAIFRTLGMYSGKISADALTTSCRRNTKPEMAETRGKRLLIASESEQGARLDESIVKQLCSTDEIQAEKKYKDPFHFTPCHTLVLYTNYLPKVRGMDDGIWSRLFVIPFNSKLRGGKGDIKNYADYLFDNAGGYIMKWIIEGARKVIDMGYHLPVPKVVSDAVGEYREQNNWFHHFIDDCCEVDPKAECSSNELYSTYRRYCQDNGEYVKSTTDFYSVLKKSGFSTIVIKRIKFIKGLSIMYDHDKASEDFLI
jgi:putative DNA primase/helicase